MRKTTMQAKREKAHRAALISLFLALSQTPAYTGTGIVYRAVCPSTPQLSLVLIQVSLHLPMEGWPG